MNWAPPDGAPNRRLSNLLQSFRRLLHHQAKMSEIEAMKRRVDRAYEDWRDDIRKEEPHEPR